MKIMTHNLMVKAFVGLTLLLALAVATWPIVSPALAQQDSHEGHDHGAEKEIAPEDPEGHGDHEGHDHGAEKEDAHEGHDHGDEGGIRLSPAIMKEFDIVVNEAVTRPLDQTLRVPGEVVFNADRMAHVTPSVSGIVQEVNLSVGDRVEAGDVMAVLSSRELAAARSDYIGANARLELERQVLERQERLLKDRIGTETAVLEARKAVREQEIALHLAEQSLHALGQSQAEIESLSELNENALGRYELKAPLSGIIIAREITRGEVVGIDSEQAPFIVANLSSVWVNLTVYQRDLVKIKAGMTVEIAFGYGIPDARGEVAFVSPALDESTRTAIARVVIENPEGQWRPGLFVTAEVFAGTGLPTVAVPRDAVTEMEGNKVVFVQTEKGFEPREVQTGRTTERFVEILVGLKPGERYVAGNVLVLKAEMNRGALEHAGHAH